jgi:hypothetical protein
MHTKAKLIVAIYAIAAGLSIGALGNPGISVYAQQPTDPNCFGEQASNLGQSGGMGEHSRAGSPFPGEPPFDQDGDSGRLGIGNFPGHPSDLAAVLGPLAGFPSCQP